MTQMSEYFPDFPKPANMDYYRRSEVDKWAKRHMVEWNMLYSQIDRVFEQRNQLCLIITELREALQKTGNVIK